MTESTTFSSLPSLVKVPAIPHRAASTATFQLWAEITGIAVAP